MTYIAPTIKELIDLRKAQGLSQATLAENMRRHPQHLSDWENGKSSPQLRNLEAWCFALGCRLAVVPVGDGNEISKRNTKTAPNEGACR